MRKDLLDKTLVIGVVVLLISISANAVSISKESTNNDLHSNPLGRKIIYVDDDNTEGPWDGTLEHPYKRIRHGVNAAEKGDTVYVFAGLYKEDHVPITKSIDIIGQDKKTTIVDGKNWENSCILVIRKDASPVRISGFTFQNIGRSGQALIISGNFNIITGNIIKNNVGTGLHLSYGWFNEISGNIISGNRQGGIHLEHYAHFNRIYNNNIKNNRNYGIYLHYKNHYNTIKKNNIISNLGYGNAVFQESFHTKWESNYWDDWNGSGPYRIKGEKLVFVGYDEYGWPEYDWVTVYDYDYSPADEPYEIITTNKYNINGYSATLKNSNLERFLNIIRGIE